MFSKISLLAIATICFCLAGFAFVQEPAADQAMKDASIFDAEYVNVTRKNHPKGRSTRIYNLGTKTIEGRVFLTGQNAAENASSV